MKEHLREKNPGKEDYGGQNEAGHRLILPLDPRIVPSVSLSA
jgi:hypothetical protein